MFKVNEYFEGKVKSLAFQDDQGNATLGIMAPGKYEFGTSDREYMTVVTGEMKVLLPAAEDWKIFKSGETFIVEPKQKFQLEINITSTYICRYEKVKGNCGCSDGAAWHGPPVSRYARPVARLFPKRKADEIRCRDAFVRANGIRKSGSARVRRTVRHRRRN